MNEIKDLPHPQHLNTNYSVRGTPCQINPLGLIDVKYEKQGGLKRFWVLRKKKEVETTIILSLHNILSKKGTMENYWLENFKGPLKKKNKRARSRRNKRLINKRSCFYKKKELIRSMVGEENQTKGQQI